MSQQKMALARRRARRRRSQAARSQPTNAYAYYMAALESQEINNALYTIRQYELKKLSQNTKTAHPSVRIIATK